MAVEMFTDLHLHTNFSDGTYTPEFLAKEAKRCSLVAVALTDHDTVEGCQRMKAACEADNIEFIPATELTAESAGIELHMLGYFLDVENPRLLEQMAHFQDCAGSGGQPCVDAGHGYRSMCIVDAASASARIGRVIDL